MLEQRVRELKSIIDEHDGANAADSAFERAVDDLLAAVYDDLGQVSATPTRTLFDLFVIKVLYVGRHSRSAGVVDYLGDLLERYIDTSQLFPPDDDGHPRRMYFSDMLAPDVLPQGCANLFEAYRKYADSALVLTGVFPAGASRPRRTSHGRLRRDGGRGVDTTYYVTTGKAMYRMASAQRQAGEDGARPVLGRLADYFELYMDALNEISDRYVMGFDMDLIADKMLDAFNRFRTSGDEGHLTDARRFAAILQVDGGRFPALFQR